MVRAMARIAVVPDPEGRFGQLIDMRELAVGTYRRRLPQGGGRFRKNHDYRSEHS